MSSLERKRSCHFSTSFGNLINLVPKSFQIGARGCSETRKLVNMRFKKHRQKSVTNKHSDFFKKNPQRGSPKSDCFVMCKSTYALFVKRCSTHVSCVLPCCSHLSCVLQWFCAWFASLAEPGATSWAQVAPKTFPGSPQARLTGGSLVFRGAGRLCHPPDPLPIRTPRQEPDVVVVGVLYFYA